MVDVAQKSGMLCGSPEAVTCACCAAADNGMAIANNHNIEMRWQTCRVEHRDMRPRWRKPCATLAPLTNDTIDTGISELPAVTTNT